MIYIRHSNLQIEAGRFHSEILVDIGDGDANSMQLFNFLVAIFEDVKDSAATIVFDKGEPAAPTNPFDLAKAIHGALDEDDPTAFIGGFGDGKNITIDGNFDLDKIAQRVLKKLRDPRVPEPANRVTRVSGDARKPRPKFGRLQL